MKKILITGNSGYIGSHLSKLLEGEYEIYGLDLNNPQHPIQSHRKHDIRQKLPANANTFDAIIHLAALTQVGESVNYPTAYYNTNINGTNWIRNIVKHKKFIFASTGSAEGMASPYSISKRVAEDMLIEQEPDCTIFRL